VIAFFLPSRLTNVDFDTFLAFARANSIGYGIYGLILFPFILILVLLKKHLLSVIFSTILLISQLDTVDYFIAFILGGGDFYFHTTGTFLLLSGLFIWVTYKSVATKSLAWYCVLVAVVLVGYFSTNGRNCRTEFLGDIGVIKNDFGLWFRNCGTYYAWWTASILINITIFREIRSRYKADNNVRVQ
jgi:hypothetical protein